MNRRRAFGAVAGLAGLGALAAGVAWQRHGESAAAGPQDGSADPALWQLRFDRPEGGDIVLSQFLGRPLLLNFWGSWCPPCVAEMPDLDRFANETRALGWQVLGLAVDNLKAVQGFLARHPVSYTIALAGFEGAALSRRLGNDPGGLPFTVLFNRQGQAVQRKAGATHLAELHQWRLEVKT